MTNEEKVELFDMYFYKVCKDLFYTCEKGFEKMKELEGGPTMAANHIISILERVKAEWFVRYNGLCIEDEMWEDVVESRKTDITEDELNEYIDEGVGKQIHISMN